MLNILSTLNGQDLGFLKMVADTWGIEIKAPDAYKAKNLLSIEMDNPELIKEIYETLPEDVRRAFDTLLENDGKVPWAKFARDYGEIRVMGSAKRDRERPDLHPGTPTEYLWYRAFIGRAFFGTETEPQEFVYIPEEIFDKLKPIHTQNTQIPGRHASMKEIHFVIPTTDRILDDICTFLGGLRNNFSLDLIEEYCDIPLAFIHKILMEMKLVSENEIMDPELIRDFLEAPREKALVQLVTQWVESNSLDEKSLIPELIVERILDHNPKNARQFILDQISLVPENQWWNLDSFINYIYQTNPDFQRPAGNYDTWYIKSKETNAYLKGFDHWHDVDGAYVHFLLTGPMHWLGLIDLASSSPDNSPLSFKCSDWCRDLIEKLPPKNIKTDDGKIFMDGYGKFQVPIRFSRAVRYQISRFCEWNGISRDGFIYHLTPSSLTRAKDQSLKISHLLKIIQPVINHPFPPKLKAALEKWENNGTQAFFNKVLLLQVADPEAINQLQTTSAKKYIQAILNPTTAVINSSGIEHVKKALIELGYMIE